MLSRWSDADADAAVARYANAGIGEAVALQVYTTRLLGADPALVLHGGGNTSVKTRMTDLLGDTHEVLCVKGSGWDMATIEPRGLPAVKLAPLRALRKLDRLADADMVAFQRANLLDPGAPNPSVETLLHAFLPHAFVDHTHSTAVLSVIDQPDGQAIARKIYGARMGIVPFIMPGFALAKAAADIFDQDPTVEGLILDKHGIFTFGADAREAYERMIAMVSLAEAHIAAAGRKVFAAAVLPAALAPLAAVAPILRGAVAESAGPHRWRRLVLDFRSNAAIRNFVDGNDVASYGRRGVVTPDHIIRTKNRPLVVPPPAQDDLAGFRNAVRDAVQRFAEEYRAYFAANRHRVTPEPKVLDPMPRLILVPGLGLFGLGKSRRDAAIAADVAEAMVRTVTDAEAVGRYAPLTEDRLFEMEYWPLEQAKLGKEAEKPLQRQIAAVTGGGGAIGAATARLFAANGAEVAILDRDFLAAERVATEVGGLAVGCDVTDPASVATAFDRIAEKLGGLDILVSNAGAAWQGRIGEVSEATLRESFELNFFGHQRVAQAATKIMLAQGTGGVLLFNASKQAVNPGANFGPYGLPKAATLSLSRQYAVDYGAEGIRSNAVNADRIRSGLLTGAMIAERSRARGVSEAGYMAGNLLRAEVTAEDVARAFLDLALAEKTTGGVATVDGGNIAAALR